MNRVFVPYKDAVHIIQEGDILLFRGGGFVSYWIKWASRGEYSHIGIASKHGHMVECVEFREFKGGRTVNLRNYVNDLSGRIDVYRVSSSALVYHLTGDHQVKRDVISYNGKAVTATMRELT